MSGFTRQPVSDADRAEKARIVQNMLRVRRNITQLFIDYGAWNALNPHEEPFTVEDLDPDGELQRLAAWLDEQLEGEIQ